MGRIYCSGLTHPGRVRRKNEDSFCLFCPEDALCSFAAVADGIGGHSKGEVASELCCTTLLNGCMKPGGFLQCPTPESQLAALTDVLRAVNDRLTLLNTLRERRSPMGTTVCAAIFGPDYVAAAYAGDSRLYEVTSDELLQRSTDHTLGQFLRGRSRMSPEQDAPQNIANVITNALGVYPELKLSTVILPRRAQCRYCLCSDGLHHVLPEHRMQTILQESMTRQIALDRLLVEVLEAGAPDNVTIVIGSEQPPKDSLTEGAILC